MIVFFMIRPRSGTQWLHRKLFTKHYKDEVYSDESPPCLNPEAKLFRKTDWSPREGVEHEVAIKNQLKSNKKYIQSSNIGYWMIPYFLKEWENNKLYDQVKFVHVIRNPIENSLSILRLHQHHFVYFDNPEGNFINQNSVFSYEGYKKNWKKYTRFERALIHWYEFHIFMEEIKDSHLKIPCLTMNFEKMMTEEGIKSLLDFCELPKKEGVLVAGQERIDQNDHRKQLGDFPDVTTIKNFPRIVDSADHYGYNFDDIDVQKLAEKYTT